MLLQSELLHALFVNVSSWMKHFLYDARLQFEMFSTYETQLLFMDFLKLKDLISINAEETDPSDWIQVKGSLPSLPKSEEEVVEYLATLFIAFLEYLAFIIDQKVINITWLPNEWIKTALNQDKEAI